MGCIRDPGSICSMWACVQMHLRIWERAWLRASSSRGSSRPRLEYGVGRKLQAVVYSVLFDSPAIPLAFCLTRPPFHRCVRRGVHRCYMRPWDPSLDQNNIIPIITDQVTFD